MSQGGSKLVMSELALQGINGNSCMDSSYTAVQNGFWCTVIFSKGTDEVSRGLSESSLLSWEI